MLGASLLSIICAKAPLKCAAVSHAVVVTEMKDKG